MTEKRIYCVSDIHLGSEYTNYEKTNKFFELVLNDADELIVCGDFYDLWRCSYKDITTKEPMRTTHELFLDVIKEVPYKFIKGNHDYDIDSYLNIRTTNYIIRDNILFVHGQQFDLQQWLGFPFSRLITTYFPYVYEKYYRQPFKTLMKESQINEYFIKYHNRIQKYAEMKGYEYIVCGHSHCPCIEKNIIDVGDMTDSCSYVILNNGIPELRRI